MEVDPVEYTAELHGRIDALTKVLMVLFTVTPMAKEVLTASRLRELAEAVPNTNAQQAAHSKGVLDVLSLLEAALTTADQAAKIRGLKPEGGH